MTEAKITEGRYLVSTNMGEGFEKYNDPVKALRLIISNYLQSRYILAKILQNPDGIEQSTISDAVSIAQSAMLELAWLRGQEGVVSKILAREVIL